MAGAPDVLVIEPDRDARELYELALGLAGVRVATATNGREALEIAKSLNPRVVLMELRLPDGDGLAVASRLAARGASPHIVGMSADLLHFTDAIARNAGCTAFFPKPCLPDVIVSEVRHSLQ